MIGSYLFKCLLLTHNLKRVNRCLLEAFYYLKVERQSFYVLMLEVISSICSFEKKYFQTVKEIACRATILLFFNFVLGISKQIEYCIS